MATVAYRFFHSFRLFNSSGEEVEIPAIKNDTYVDLFDITATYGVSKRLSLTLELPIQYGSRTNANENDGVHFHTRRASGIGDMRLGANFLLLNPDKHPNENISLGLGVKAPLAMTQQQIFHSVLPGRCCDRLTRRFSQEMEAGALFCHRTLSPRCTKILLPTPMVFT